MKTTVVGLVTPHVLRVMDLANQSQAGINVDWHLRDAVARTVDVLSQQFNAAELLAAYVHGLEATAQEAGQGRRAYAGMLRTAAEMAARERDKHA